MDNDLQTPSATVPPSSSPSPSPSSAEPLSLPFPFDDDVDRPIDLVLTGAAHRELDPAGVPVLRLVTSVVEDPHPSDTRPAQARALLRSGMPVTTIAAALGVPEGVVLHWTLDVEVSRRRRVQPERATRPRDLRPRVQAMPPKRSDEAASAGDQDDTFLRGVAQALVRIADATVSIVHDRPELVGLLVTELRRRTDVAIERFRVSVRVAPPLATDRVRREVASLLGVDLERVIAGRTAQPLTSTGIEVRVDVSDELVASVVRRWLDLPASVVRRGA
jgi:hypothetical protein